MKKSLIVRNDPIRFTNKALAANSFLTYSDSLKSFREFLRKRNKVENAESVIDFFRYLKSKVSPATFNNRIYGLKSYLLEKHRNNPKQLFGIQETFKSIRKAKVTHSVLDNKYIPYQEILAIQDKLPSPYNLIFQALFWTGVRVSEILALTHADLKPGKHCTVHIRHGKGDKEHTTYLPMPLYEKIKSLPSKKYIFESKPGRPYNRKTIHRIFKKFGEEIGKRITPHTMRHSRAMMLKDTKNLSADQICKFLNHSDVATTLRFYFHGTPTAADVMD